MNSNVFAQASSELNTRIVTLLDSLSAMSTLSSLEIVRLEERELLRQALDILIKNVDMERCSVFLVDRDRLINSAGIDWDDVLNDVSQHQKKPGPAQTFCVGEGIMGIAAQKQSLEHCRDCSADPRFKPFSSRPNSSVTGSVISVPITGGGNVLGVLNVSHPERGFFDSWHERLLTLYSSALGHLLLNSRLLHSMEQEIAERTEQLRLALEEASTLKARYRELSIIDDLTLLHNRRFFFPEARAALERAVRYNQPFSLIILDLDYFKTINDRFGHSVGDRVLVDTAGILQASIRSCDILARIGGEEFAIALPNTLVDGTVQLAERIATRVKSHKWEHQGESFNITVSAGISFLSEETRNSGGDDLLEHLVEQADSCMYRSKDAGRDRIFMYAPNEEPGQGQESL